MAMAETVDLEDVVKRWADQMFEITKNKEQSKLSKESLIFTVIWKRVKFSHSHPEFRDKEKPPQPKTMVLFKTFFSNETSMDQEYSFRTQRTTRSTCDVSVEQAYTVGYEMNVSMKTPCEVFEANAGFHRELELVNAQGQTIEEELSWEVDSQIKVPQGYKTIAELVISEDEFSGVFDIASAISGTVIVNVTNPKDNNSLVKTFENNIVEVMRVMRDKEKGLKMFTLEKKVANFSTRGSCNFRFGIEQHVRLTQEKI